jgi:hypothetical protein
LALLPTLGRSTTPVVISGAVTMKMISSTSMTSMNGTMLISFIVRRPRPRVTTAGIRLSDPPPAAAGAAGVALQDVGELLDEGLELDGDAVDVAREAVVGHHRRDGREQADGGGHQGLGDARRHGGQRHLLQVGQADEGMHDAPHGAEQADVGRPTRPRPGSRLLSTTSSSRWKLARMARRAPSSWVPAS